MTVDIGQGFLNGAENGNLYVLRHSWEIIQDLQCSLDIAALGKAIHKPLKCGRKPDFIEQRRMQKMRDGANFIADLIHDISVFAQAASTLRAELVSFARQIGNVHGECSQKLADAVVQFASQAPALLILNSEKAASQLHKLITRGKIRNQDAGC